MQPSHIWTHDSNDPLLWQSDNFHSFKSQLTTVLDFRCIWLFFSEANPKMLVFYSIEQQQKHTSLPPVFLMKN